MSRNPKSSRATPSVCTCLLLRKASRRVSMIYDRHLSPYGMTITQYGLLAHLQRHDGISLGALAEKLVMDPTTLTRNLRPIEKKGWIVSNQDPQDARTKRLHLTDAGRTIRIEARAGWDAAQQHIATALGQDDSEKLAGVVDLLLDRLAD